MTSIPQQATILLIDDEPQNLRMMVEFLEEEGYQILIAQDGEGGLRRAAYVRPDLILLDAILPDIDGFMLCEQLKKNEITSQIPIIFLTILTIPEDRVRAIEAGASDYVTKPVQWEELLLRINIHMHIRDLTRQLHEAKGRLSEYEKRE
ncbi:MAG: response regulator [Caldilineaceae bacterium]